jgi:uncharacterized protein (DUF1501 family)
MVVPHGEDAYYSLRPSLGVPRPDDSGASKGKRALDLDGFFGLHPAMESLLPVWQAGELAIVHACGAPDESRSHFKAMELMERGAEDERGPARLAGCPSLWITTPRLAAVGQQLLCNLWAMLWHPTHSDFT